MERTAQTKLICPVCKGIIKPGHKYTWLEVKRMHPVRGEVIHLLRVHPECKTD